ncbi:hypothetical protein GCM10009745_73310 [Kribbella yunnanensis]|uniref:Uncharacterized protein n=1 Tax=Kribbella yunnanensis TaxID=190194 RepID=A0ABP4V1F5_9ACTN
MADIADSLRRPDGFTFAQTQPWDGWFRHTAALARTGEAKPGMQVPRAETLLHGTASGEGQMAGQIDLPVP